MKIKNVSRKFFVIIVLLFCSTTNSFGDSKLSVFQVFVEMKKGDMGNFEEGEAGHPNYPRFSKPSYFVKKSPDLVFNKQDILKVEINRAPSLIENDIRYVADIFFNSQAAKRLSEYSGSNIGQYIALKIDNELFAVGQILEALGPRANIPMVGKSIGEIRSIFSKVSKTVIIKENLVL